MAIPWQEQVRRALFSTWLPVLQEGCQLGGHFRRFGARQLYTLQTKIVKISWPWRGFGVALYLIDFLIGEVPKMRRSPVLTVVLLLITFGVLMTFFISKSVISVFSGEGPVNLEKNSVAVLELEGVILDGKKFLKQLKKYRKDDRIKAFVININSPGGVVGPSQEINTELIRTRTEFKKPVVAISSNLMASGAYYSAVAADKIIVAPGALVGSIGVIMEFANLEKLYDWAKVSRYTITSGKFKDSGSEYRPMRDDERQLFQDMINEVYEQFVDAIAVGRNMKADDVRLYADGRVMTGAQSVKLGFADSVGTIEEAQAQAAELAGLGKHYEIFEPPKSRPGLLELLSSEEDVSSQWNHIVNKVLKTELVNRPLYLMSGAW